MMDEGQGHREVVEGKKRVRRKGFSSSPLDVRISVTAFVPQNVHDALVLAAADGLRSLSAQVKWIVIDWFNREKQLVQDQQMLVEEGMVEDLEDVKLT